MTDRPSDGYGPIYSEEELAEARRYMEEYRRDQELRKDPEVRAIMDRLDQERAKSQMAYERQQKKAAERREVIERYRLRCRAPPQHRLRDCRVPDCDRLAQFFDGRCSRHHRAASAWGDETMVRAPIRRRQAEQLLKKADAIITSVRTHRRCRDALEHIAYELWHYNPPPTGNKRIGNGRFGRQCGLDPYRLRGMLDWLVKFGLGEREFLQIAIAHQLWLRQAPRVSQATEDMVLVDFCLRLVKVRPERKKAVRGAAMLKLITGSYLRWNLAPIACDILRYVEHPHPGPGRPRKGTTPPLRQTRRFPELP